MVVGGEVVEVAGVEKDLVMTEEMDGEVFVGSMGGGVGGVTKGCIPAGFGVEELGGGVRAELRFEVGEIFLDVGEELGEEGVALGEERGDGGLGGRAEREISVGDDFEAIESGADLGGGTGNG